MKNHRYVCAATHAGYAEFKGKIRTGCPKTPAHKSSYCSVHTPCVAVCHEPLEGDKASGTNESVEQPVGLIIDKRITRNSTLYKVYVYICRVMKVFK